MLCGHLLAPVVYDLDAGVPVVEHVVVHALGLRAVDAGSYPPKALCRLALAPLIHTQELDAWNWHYAYALLLVNLTAWYLATYSLYGVPSLGVVRDTATVFLWPLLSLEEMVLCDPLTKSGV